MLSPENFTLLTILIYFFSTGCGLFGMLTRWAIWRQIGCWLAVAAFLCQTVILILGFHKFLPGGLSLGAYLQMLAWFLLLCGISAWLRWREDALILFAAPLGLMLFLMSSLWLNLLVKPPVSLSGIFYIMHIGCLFLSLGLLSLAFIAAVIFLFIERRIKSKKNMQGVWKDMPALSILDKINSICVLSAFPLYTLGILTGFFWAKPVFGSIINGDLKEVLSLIIWVLLAVVFHNRLARGWIGKKPASIVIIIVLLSFFSILIVNTFLPTHHDFIQN